MNAAAVQSETPTPNADWIDLTEYPFEPHFLDLPAGRMHYVDEGQGSPIVMVHGTPTWSFLYRHLIQDLSASHRCIAPDNLGFGLSDSPYPYTLRIEDHARNLETLIERLGLKDITLVVHDFGGPIGLSYALEHPENVAALVLFNTWMWSLEDDASLRRRLKFFASPVGRFLYTRLNFSPRVILKAAWGNRSRLTKAVHRHYTNAFPTPRSREATWVFARDLLGASRWYEQLWSRRDRIAEKPALLLWGLKDPAFAGQLPRWRAVFTNARVVTYPDAGHFVQEEVEGVGATVEEFLANYEPGA